DGLTLYPGQAREQVVQRQEVERGERVGVGGERGWRQEVARQVLAQGGHGPALLGRQLPQAGQRPLLPRRGPRGGVVEVGKQRPALAAADVLQERLGAVIHHVGPPLAASAAPATGRGNPAPATGRHAFGGRRGRRRRAARRGRAAHVQAA